MKHTALTLFKIVVSVAIHLVLLAVIGYLLRQVGEWYLAQLPLKGIDFFNTASYVSYLRDYPWWRVNLWKYTWFEGMPLSLDYQSLFFYLLLPLAKIYGLIRGIQIGMVIAGFSFIAACYLLFSFASRNRFLGVVLALAVGFSISTYRSLVWAGGLPFFVSQLFLPLTLYLLLKHIAEYHKRRYLLLSALTSGIGVMGHPQSFISFVFPTTLILLVISAYSKDKIAGWYKVKDLFIYFGLTVLVGLPGLYYLLFRDFIVRLARLAHVNLLSITPPADPGRWTPEVAEWARSQFFVAFKETNWLVWGLLTFAVVAGCIGFILVKKKRRHLFNTLALFLTFGWVVFYIFLLSRGINVYHGGIDSWYKLFWAMPVVGGLLVSHLFGLLSCGFTERLQTKKQWLIRTISELGLGLVVMALVVVSYPSFKGNIVSHIADISLISSAFPEAVSVRTSAAGLTRVKSEVKPSFIADTPYDFRLYSNDQTVSIWWNSLFATPLARGYIDPSGTIDERWGLFWLDAVCGVGAEGGTSLGDDWHVPESVVKNNIPFLFDWYGVGYLEGNHASHGSTGKLPELVTSDTFISDTEITRVQGGIGYGDIKDPSKGEWREDLVRELSFYKVKSDLVKPIHQAVMTPAVLLIGGEDSFDILTRVTAMMDWGPQKLIIVRGPKFIDAVLAEELREFDAVFLYKYDYKNHDVAWRRIEDYVRLGGHVFVETGTEVKESDTAKLPGTFPKTLPRVFPVENTVRSDVGNSWDAAEISDEFSDTDIGTFSDLVFNNGPWNVSHPANGQEGLRKDAQVYLQSTTIPVIAEQSIGSGKIIWSGVNLPYHALYNYNQDEGAFLIRLWQGLLPDQVAPVEYNLHWISPNLRKMTASGGSGFLLKEKHYAGWSAEISTAKKKLHVPIYDVGPSSPGFMYIRIPKELRNEQISATFSYSGSTDSWIVQIVSFITLLFILDNVAGGFVGKHTIGKIMSRIRKRTHKWWKEDENY